MASNIQVTLELDDRGFLTGIKTAESEVKKLGASADATAAKSSNMFGKIGSDADLALTRIKGLALAFVGVQAVMSSLSLGDQLSDLSNATGISIETILGLQGALQKAGGNAEDAGKMISKMSQTLDQANQGAAGAQDTLRRLGFSLGDMGKLAPEEALQKTIDKLAGMTNPIERNALAFDLLGKSARTIDWMEVQKGLTDSTGKYTEAAIAARQAGEAWDKLGEHAKNAKIGLMIAIAPLNDLLDLLGKLSGGTGGDVIKALQFVFKALAIDISLAATGLMMIVDNIKTVAGLIPAVFSRDWDKVNSLIDDNTKSVKQKWDDMRKYIGGTDLFNQKPPAEIAKPKATTGTTSAPDAFAGEKNSILGIADAYARANEKQREKIQADYDALGATDSVKKVESERLRIMQSSTDEIIKLQSKYEGLTAAQKRAGEGQTIIDTMQRIIAVRDEDLVKSKEQITANEAYQRSFEAGWSKAFNSYVDSATNAASQAKAMFDVVTSGMNAAIDKFVETGKFSFSDFSQYIIKEILKIQLKSAMANVFGATDKAAGAGGIMGLFSGMFKASGGAVSAGQPYITGEKGMELFVPQTAGTIIPNNQLGSSGGGGGTTIINNISAIDSRSVAQLFAENRMTLFGTVEQARRELPMRTR